MTIDETLVCSFHVLKPAELKNGDKGKNGMDKKVNYFFEKIN